MKKIKSFLIMLSALFVGIHEGVTTNGYTDDLLDSMSSDFEKSNFDAHGALNLTESEVATFKKVHNKIRQADPGNPLVSGGRQSGGEVKYYGQIASPDTITSLVTNSKGDLNITVTRKTHTIAQSLPYILFGLQGFTSNFASTLKPFLPSGFTATFTNNANGDMVGTYTNGILTDTIEVNLSGGLISYAEFLQSMNQNYFKTKYIRYEVADDANRLAQQAEMINFGLLSALGAKNANQLLVRSRIQSWTYQKSITEILMPEQKITSDFSFIQNAIYVAANTPYSIAWDVFMSDRVNLNKA